MKEETCGNCSFSESIFGITKGGEYDARVYCLCTHSNTVEKKKTNSCRHEWRLKEE